MTATAHLEGTALRIHERAASRATESSRNTAYSALVRISQDELALLTAACANRGNTRAHELMNVLGSSNGEEIVRQITSLPARLRRELETHVREAIDEERRRGASGMRNQ